MKKTLGILGGLWLGLTLGMGTGFAHEATQWLQTSCSGKIQVREAFEPTGTPGNLTLQSNLGFYELTPGCQALEKGWGLFSKFQNQRQVGHIVGNPDAARASKIAAKLENDAAAFTVEVGIIKDANRDSLEAIVFRLSPKLGKGKVATGKELTLSATELVTSLRVNGGGTYWREVGQVKLALEYEAETR